MIAGSMTREVAVRTLLAKTSRNKFRLPASDATFIDDDYKSVASTISPDAQRTIISAQKSPAPVSGSIAGSIRYPPSSRMNDYDNDSISRTSTIITSNPRIDSARVVHARATPSAVPTNTLIIDPEELRMSRLLADQERRFGINMLDFLTPNNP